MRAACGAVGNAAFGAFGGPWVVGSSLSMLAAAVPNASFEKTLEAMESLEDTPSHQLIANRWAPAPSE